MIYNYRNLVKSIKNYLHKQINQVDLKYRDHQFFLNIRHNLVKLMSKKVY